MRTLVAGKISGYVHQETSVGKREGTAGNKTKIVIQNRERRSGSDAPFGASSGGARCDRRPATRCRATGAEMAMIGFALAKSNTPAGGHKVQAGLAVPPSVTQFTVNGAETSPVRTSLTFTSPFGFSTTVAELHVHLDPRRRRIHQQANQPGPR